MSAESIMNKIAECLSVISRTSTKDVNGALVTPVKNAIIPESTKMIGFGAPNKVAIFCPKAAPVAKDGAKIPPAHPYKNYNN